MRLVLLYGGAAPRWAGGFDAAVHLGDFLSPRAVEELARVGTVYAVPGRLDDHSVAEAIAEHMVSLEGRLVYIGGGFYAAGVGGREPLANVARLLEEEPAGPVVLASYYPPHGVCDSSRLGVRRGLWELGKLIARLRPVLAAVRGAGGCCLERGGIVYACLDHGCWGEAVIEGDSLVSCRVRCSG